MAHFRDEFDGNTLEQVERLTGKAPKIAKAEGIEGKNNSEKHFASCSTQEKYELLPMKKVGKTHKKE